MCLNFRVISVLCLLTWPFSQLSSQNKDDFEAGNGVYGQIKVGYVQPYGFGDNALGKGYNLNGGFSVDPRIYFSKHFYVGLQGSQFQGDVIDIERVGSIDESSISHGYLQGGYSFLPRSEKFGIDAGLGLGYAVYRHTKKELGGESDFKDNGFSLMGNVTGNYRFSTLLGAYIGVQINKDFLNIESAPEVASFFKNANMVYFTAGIQFHINQ